MDKHYMDMGIDPTINIGGAFFTGVCLVVFILGCLIAGILA